MDLQMADVSSYAVAEKIRDSGASIGAIPMIAISSRLERNAKKCMDAGFDGFLGKPISRKKRIQVLERVLGSKNRTEKPEQEKITTQHSIREDLKRSIRILLAEDNPVNQKLANLMLTKAGYQVTVSGNGRETVEKYSSSPQNFDLIFMDVQMPEMDGLEATGKIRNLGFHDIPIVAMTAHAMKGHREKCVKAGMNDYVTKPIKREIVFEMIEKWVLK